MFPSKAACRLPAVWSDSVLATTHCEPHPPSEACNKASKHLTLSKVQTDLSVTRKDGMNLLTQMPPFNDFIQF